MSQKYMKSSYEDTEITENESRYIPRTKYSNKSSKIEKHSEMHIHKDNLSVSVLSGQGEILSSVTPDIIRILLKSKSKNTPETSIIIK